MRGNRIANLHEDGHPPNGGNNQADQQECTTQNCQADHRHRHLVDVLGLHHHVVIRGVDHPCHQRTADEHEQNRESSPEEPSLLGRDLIHRAQSLQRRNLRGQAGSRQASDQGNHRTSDHRHAEHEVARDEEELNAALHLIGTKGDVRGIQDEDDEASDAHTQRRAHQTESNSLPLHHVVQLLLLRTNGSQQCQGPAPLSDENLESIRDYQCGNEEGEQAEGEQEDAHKVSAVAQVVHHLLLRGAARGHLPQLLGEDLRKLLGGHSILGTQVQAVDGEVARVVRVRVRRDFMSLVLGKPGLGLHKVHARFLDSVVVVTFRLLHVVLRDKARFVGVLELLRVSLLLLELLLLLSQALVGGHNTGNIELHDRLDAGCDEVILRSHGSRCNERESVVRVAHKAHYLGLHVGFLG